MLIRICRFKACSVEKGTGVYMIALQIKSVKNFMAKFLASDTFDLFLLEEASVTTATVFSIDGHQVKEFYTSEEWEDASVRPYDLIEWAKMRDLVFSLIKGKHTPVNFKFVLHVKPEHVASILEKGDTAVTPDQIRAFVLTVKYDGSSLSLITATGAHSFLLDKTPDNLWDQAIRRFMDKTGLEFQEV